MIEVKNLTKKFGPHTAVDNISFVVNDGEILGFLGPNGAGKTTTMNMMTGFISSTEGTVRINGYDILDEPVKAKKQLGYLPDVPPLYGDMTVEEYLDFVCDLKGVKKADRPSMTEEIITTVKIKEVYKRLIKNLSKGYRQRVGLAQALVGFPEVLILDEPTVGLDPKQIIEMRDLIRRLGERHTVILSSHILSEVSAVCDRVMIINKGKIVATDTTEGLSGRADNSTQLITVRGNGSEICQNLMEWAHIENALIESDNGDGTYDIRVEGEKGIDIREIINKALSEKNIPLLMLRPVALNLEEAFLKVINGELEDMNVKNQEALNVNITEGIQEEEE